MNDNKSTISVITTTVATSAFACIITVCVLAYMGKQIPPELNTLTGGLVGSLVSMLVKTSPTQSTTVPPITPSTEPVKTEIVNPPESPVPVTTETKP
jgi:hypothetical protein